MTEINSAASANVLVSLGEKQTRQVVSLILENDPDLVGFQEWGKDRNNILDNYNNYHWSSPGFMPVGIKKDVGRIVSSKRITLASERQGVRATYANETIVRTNDTKLHSVLNLHLVAHHDERAYFEAWKEGKQSVEKWIRQCKNSQPWIMGDVNKHLLTFNNVISCWKDNAEKPTFGDRTIDGIWTTKHARRVITVNTPSDHHAIVARY